MPALWLPAAATAGWYQTLATSPVVAALVTGLISVLVVWITSWFSSSQSKAQLRASSEQRVHEASERRFADRRAALETFIERCADEYDRACDFITTHQLAPGEVMDDLQYSSIVRARAAVAMLTDEATATAALQLEKTVIAFSQGESTYVEYETAMTQFLDVSRRLLTAQEGRAF